ncbi:MAG: hypothetical protein ACI9D5_000933 [Candidatus Endobugula sp.]|jgi:hypothetical protein
MNVRAVYLDHKGMVYVVKQESMKIIVLRVAAINNSITTLKIGLLVSSERSVLNEVFKLR